MKLAYFITEMTKDYYFHVIGFECPYCQCENMFDSDSDPFGGGVLGKVFSFDSCGKDSKMPEKEL